MKGWVMAGAALAFLCDAAMASSGVPPDYAEPSAINRAISSAISPDHHESAPLKGGAREQIPDCPPEAGLPQVPPDYAAGVDEATTVPRKELLPSYERLPLQDQLDLLKRNQADIDARLAAKRELKTGKASPSGSLPCIKR